MTEADDTAPAPPPPAAAAIARRAAGAAAPDATELRARFGKFAESPAAEAPATSGDEETRIRGLIDEMRPTFRRDGGDIELVRIEGAKVIVHLSGACAGCMLAGQTLHGVQKRITDVIGRPFRVIPDIRH